MRSARLLPSSLVLVAALIPLAANAAGYTPPPEVPVKVAKQRIDAAKAHIDGVAARKWVTPGMRKVIAAAQAGLASVVERGGGLEAEGAVYQDVGAGRAPRPGVTRTSLRGTLKEDVAIQASDELDEGALGTMRIVSLEADIGITDASVGVSTFENKSDSSAHESLKAKAKLPARLPRNRFEARHADQQGVYDPGSIEISQSLTSPGRGFPVTRERTVGKSRAERVKARPAVALPVPTIGETRPAVALDEQIAFVRAQLGTPIAPTARAALTRALKRLDAVRTGGAPTLTQMNDTRYNAVTASYGDGVSVSAVHHDGGGGNSVTVTVTDAQGTVAIRANDGLVAGVSIKTGRGRVMTEASSMESFSPGRAVYKHEKTVEHALSPAELGRLARATE